MNGLPARDLPPGESRGPRLASAGLVLLLAAIYLPSIGRGLIKDDFRWIVAGQVHQPSDVARIFATHVGVYRPVVALSFGLTHRVVGLHPLAYGLTNFALLCGCVLAIASLARRLGLAPAFAVGAAGLWALNFHGIGGALLWPSGRSALLLCLFGVLAAIAWLDDRPVRAAAWTVAALFSKEEAAVLPLLLGIVAVEAGRPARWKLHAALAVVALGTYLALRHQSGAFWPGTAPDYYRPSFGAAGLARNVAEYADRSATVAVAALLAAWALARVRPRLDRARRVWRLGAAWLLVGFAPTLTIPARSSLYVLWPTIGTSLLAAAFLQDLVAAVPPRRRRALAIAALTVPWLLYPVYHLRNQRMKNVGELSRAAIERLQALDGSLPRGAVVVLRDDRSTHASLSNAFGTLLDDVRTLAIPRASALVLDPPPEGALPVSGPPGDRPRVVAFRVERGRIESEPTP